MSSPLDDRTASKSRPSAAWDGALSSVFGATIPAVLAYFVGWVYLYYYLAEFGIGISELDLGVETIFIYAAPPVAKAAKGSWLVIALVVLLAVVLVATWRRMPNNLRFGFRKLRMFEAVPPVLFGVGLVVSLMLLAAISASVTRGVALEHASERWDRVGVRIQAAAAEPTSLQVRYADYKLCVERRALDLIFADKNSYFMLCISEINDANGVVYEVRREGSSFASVRSIQRRLLPHR